MARRRERKLKWVGWIVLLGFFSGSAVGAESDGAKDGRTTLASATRFYETGNYVRAFQLYEQLDARGELQEKKDRQRWGYCHMKIAYEFYYAYKENPRFTPTDEDWEEVAGLVRKARRLAPSLTYSDRVVEAIDGQMRRKVKLASKGESATLGRKR